MPTVARTLPRLFAIAALLLAATQPGCTADQSARPDAHPTAAAASPLQFRITEGQVENAFYQDGPVAAHLLLTSGTSPRVLVAFPAGNSGVGLWFDDAATPVQWSLDEVKGTQIDEGGQVLHGIVAEARLAGGPLRLREAVLGSVRVLRDYQLLRKYPAETATPLQLSERSASWKRARLDGAPGYAITLTADNGRFRRDGDGALVLEPDVAGEPLRLRLAALTGETPLTPFAGDALLNERAGGDERSRNALRFLSYREKFLAGSWRFDTYFGRDTLMSLRLLLPALRPQAIESGLASVLARIDAHGEVAHEEDIGEFAVLRHRREDGTTSAEPIHDYGMIDDDFMLAAVAAAYLLDDPEGRARAPGFLAQRLPSGTTVGAALARNFDYVLSASQAFARDPSAGNLLALKPGRNVGQWRDSENGLARGRYAYDVNAVWIPAALSAVARLQAQGLLAPYADADRQRAFADAAASAQVWSERAPGLFAVSLDPAAAREKVREYAAKTGVDPRPALASLPEGPLRFAALALDARLQPIPVLHSDVGFALLFTDPSAATVDAMVASALRPFPAGLLTDVGMMSADPAYADAPVQALFDRNAYHGTGVWSWQQALMAAGLQRQLARSDLPAPVRTRLQDAQARLWKAIKASRELRTSELWSWRYANGRYTAVPFGQGKADVDESNAAQLWSTVFLAIPEPETSAQAARP
ncbi:MAG: hypothetical protein QM601_04415 [Pseudoxanthomonas sp.]